MNALFLKDLADKTHRGLRGRVEDGRSAGGLCYGYRVVKSLTGSAVTTGEREIEPSEAAIVERIPEYVAGIVPVPALRMSKCGVCGAGFIMAGRNRLACFGAREKGTCDIRLTIRRDDVEARVLKALQEKLLRQDLFDEFCEEFTRETNRLRMEHRASLSAAAREIERIDARRKKLIEMMMEGVAPPVVKDELNANAARREQLEAQLAATEEPPPLLHPEMAKIYRTKVRELAKALQEPESRSEATEALRGLLDAIVLTPNASGETLQIDLRGVWRPRWGATVQTKRPPESDDLFLQVSLVAGAHNKLYRQLCWAAA